MYCALERRKIQMRVLAFKIINVLKSKEHQQGDTDHEGARSFLNDRHHEG